MNDGRELMKAVASTWRIAVDVCFLQRRRRRGGGEGRSGWWRRGAAANPENYRILIIPSFGLKFDLIFVHTLRLRVRNLPSPPVTAPAAAAAEVG